MIRDSSSVKERGEEVVLLTTSATSCWPSTGPSPIIIGAVVYNFAVQWKAWGAIFSGIKNLLVQWEGLILVHRRVSFAHSCPKLPHLR